MKIEGLLNVNDFRTTSKQGRHYINEKIWMLYKT